jgi:malyl-CoA/(S)-citramalyl-CoA lyase
MTFGDGARNPREYFRPLAIGAPRPTLDVTVSPSRMIHFFDPSNEKMVGKLPQLASQVDILLGNLEDAIPADRKEAARNGLIKIANTVDLKGTPLWVRINSLESPWVLDDITQLVSSVGNRIAVIMVPKIEGPRDIHYLDRLLAQLEAREGLINQIALHAIIETSLGVINLESIASSSPRMQGMSFGPADLAASRGMKTIRPGGPHPGYRVLDDSDPACPEVPRVSVVQDLWHYSIARMVDACTASGILPFYGPFGDISDVDGCESQFRAAYLLGCVGAWSLHPTQIEIARNVFSPDSKELAFAHRVIESMPDGRGVLVIDGKMQDDASWKQSQVLMSLARMLAERDPSFRPILEHALKTGENNEGNS